MSTQDWFIERVGVNAEADGLSRIAGRLFGALMLSEEPRSLDELAEALQVSKASVSVEARRLLERGVFERLSRPGDRRDYYQLAPDFFGRVIRHRLARWSELQALANEVRRDGDLTPAVERRIVYVDDVHTFVLARVEEALRDWTERERSAKTAAAKRPARPRARA
jgi:DNA-binding transcriptional regulator GbsR (MarR family)